MITILNNINTIYLLNKKFIRLGNVIRLGEAGWGFKTKIPSSVQIH